MEGTQQAAARSAPPDEKQLFSCKRRKRGEPARCRVPGCDVELPSQFHEKYRICPRHYTAPSVHVAGEAWRFCQQCAKFHTLADFTDDRRSCNKSLTSHNRRRRGVPRSAPRHAGDSSSGGSGGRRTARRTAQGTTQAAAAANGLDTGSSGSIRGVEGASPHATAGSGGATPPASASAAAPENGAEGSKSSATPPRNGYLTTPAGSGSLAQEAPRHNSAPPAACGLPPADQPFLPTIAEQGGLPWPQPSHLDRAVSAPAAGLPAMLPPLPPLGLPWQGPAGAPLHAQDEEGRNFDSVLMGLLLADSPRAANGEARQQHAHAALLDAYGSLLDQPDSTVPSCQELLDIADELGIFADHLADPMLPGSEPAPEQAQQAQQAQGMALSGGTPTSMAPHSVQPADALAGAAGGSSSTATASSSATAALMPRFPGLPGDASSAVAAALQAAQAAGMPALPAWQQAQQAAQLGGKQTGDASALAEQYTSLDRMERLSFKIFGCHPSELAPDVHSELSQMVQASIAACSQPHMQGFVRPGCTFLTVDLRLERPEEDAGAAAAAPVHGGSGGGGGSGNAGEGPSQGLQHASSKQLDGILPDPEAGGAAGSNGSHAAALLHSLAAQALQRRSMGVAASASPLLAQLNTQQMVAAAGGRLMRSLPLPAAAPAQTANATPAPQLPQLAAISPVCLVLPSAGPSAPEQPVIVLTGHGLFAHTGRSGLVLARQHGRHLPVEVWGGSDGAGGSPGALVVSITGLRPGVCELEVQRGSVLGSSRPLLVLPAGMEAQAAELAALASSGGGGTAGGSSSAGADAFLRDVGAVVAWVELRNQQAAAPAGPAAFYTGSEGSLGSESGGESDAEMEEEEWQAEQQGAGMADAADRQDSAAEAVTAEPPLPLLPPAHVARLAHHAARFALRVGWDATAAALESAAAAAAEAAEEAAAAAAAAPPAPVPAPGWVQGSATLLRDEHALDFEFWAPLWQQQLQREGQAAAAASLTAWWQPAAGPASTEPQQRAVPDERYWVSEDDLKGQGQSSAARSGLASWKAAAAVAAVLSTAAALSALCWG